VIPSTSATCYGANDGSISAAFGGGGTLEMNIDGGAFTVFFFSVFSSLWREIIPL
jgi:hypothetical protein